MRNEFTNQEQERSGFEMAMDAFGMSWGLRSLAGAQSKTPQPVFASAFEAFGMGLGSVNDAFVVAEDEVRGGVQASVASAMRAFGTGWRNRGRRPARRGTMVGSSVATSRTAAEFRK